MDFYKDDTKIIADNIAKLVNIAKEGLDTLNESTFVKILFAAFIRSKNASQYKIVTQASSGGGYLDVIVYFNNRADLYELKFELKVTNRNVKKILEDALQQIYIKDYMSTIIHKISGDESKKSIKSIKLIPMLLYRIGSEADYQCQVGEVKNHTIEDARKISAEKSKGVGKNINKKKVSILVSDDEEENIKVKSDIKPNKTTKDKSKQNKEKEQKLTKESILAKLKNSYNKKDAKIIADYIISKFTNIMLPIIVLHYC
jgi:hypothetical protein